MSVPRTESDWFSSTEEPRPDLLRQFLILNPIDSARQRKLVQVCYVTSSYWIRLIQFDRGNWSSSRTKSARFSSKGRTGLKEPSFAAIAAPSEKGQMSLYVYTRMWRVGEKRVFDSNDDDGETRLASTWCSTQPPMTKNSVAAPRDLSFVIKTTSIFFFFKSNR